jgi:hypothetical protein
MFCGADPCWVGPFCRNGRSAKPNPELVPEHTMNVGRFGVDTAVSTRFAAIRVELVAAGRDVLPGRQDVLKPLHGRLDVLNR